MPQLLYAAELTLEVPKKTVVLENHAFCELVHAVLDWEEALPAAQWLVEICPGRNRSYFAVCRLTIEHPDAVMSCIALQDGAIRLVALNAAAAAARGVRVHVTGDLDPTGEIESFYAVSCTGLQDWKISSEVEFFETFSVVVRTPELVRKENRAYVQILYKNRWINIAHIPGEQMWVLIKDRLIVKGDRIRCILVGPDAKKPYVWDIVTALDDLTEKSDDDRDSYLAEAEEVATDDAQESEESQHHILCLDKVSDRLYNDPPIAIDVEDSSDEIADSSPGLMAEAAKPKRQRLNSSKIDVCESISDGRSPAKRPRISDESVPGESSEAPPEPDSPLAEEPSSVVQQLTVEIDSEGDDDFVIDGVAEETPDPIAHNGKIDCSAAQNLSSDAPASSRKPTVACSAPKAAHSSRAAKKAMCATSPLSPNIGKKSSKSGKSKQKGSSGKASADPPPAPNVKVSGRSRPISIASENRSQIELASSSPKSSPVIKADHKSPSLAEAEAEPPARGAKPASAGSKKESSPKATMSEIEATYLRDLRAIVKETGACRLSTLGARVKKPVELQKKLVDFLKSSGEFEFKNTDVVLLKKK